MIAAVEVEDRRGVQGVRGISGIGEHVVVGATVRHIHGRTGGIAGHRDRRKNQAGPAVDPEFFIHLIIHPVGKVFVRIFDRNSDHEVAGVVGVDWRPVGFPECSRVFCGDGVN